MTELTQISAGSNSQIYAYGKGDNQVILKVVAAKNKKEQKHLKNQFQLLQRLNHRNIVKSLRYRQNVVFPGNKTDKQLSITTTTNILVLQYASKGSLLTYLEQQKPDIYTKRQAFRSIAQGLAYLHSQGIAHRDIKLQNILVFAQVNSQTFKISDLGFATRFKQNNKTLKFTEYKGTRKGYMAPEIHQCAKGHQNSYDAAKADIFALGVILFALVFGHLPFQYAVPSNIYYKYIVQKQFSLFWGAHNSTKLQMQEGYRLQQMKVLFQRMINFDPSQRPEISQVIQSLWLKE